MRILDIINSTTVFFQKKGLESPRLQIELLLAHHLNLKRLDLYLQFERELSDSELEPLREMVKKRAAGMPLQHITRIAPFYGRDFIVTEDVLIPRPETEQLVEFALGKLRGMHPVDARKLRVLDLCTGSGIIGITLALEMDGIEIVAADISQAALEIARRNAGKHLTEEKAVEFIHSDLFSSLAGRFDLVMTNPPYIATDIIGTLSREVQCDPVLALDGGADGLEVIRKIMIGSPHFLQPEGWLLIEIGHDQAVPLVDLFSKNKFQSTGIFKDISGFDRIATGQMAPTVI